MKQTLIGLNLEELTKIVVSLGTKSFRAKQLYRWLYNNGATSFTEMTNISSSLKEELQKKYSIKRLKVITDMIAQDKTHKWILECNDKNQIETSLIPQSDHNCACISSQIGCSLTCKFCSIGTNKLSVRNLEVNEIVEQILTIKDTYHNWYSHENNDKVIHIAITNMGEPLYNYENVKKALHLITDTNGIGILKENITIYTSGIAPLLEAIPADIGCKIAIGLHAPNDKLRSKIMPINKKYPLNQLIPSLKKYSKHPNSYPITFEYIMLKNFNDKPQHARELLSILNGLSYKINLIPFNSWKTCNPELQPSDNKTIQVFSEIIKNSQYQCYNKKTT